MIKMPWLFICYLVAFVTANLIVKHFGVYGMWLSSFFLIPFDFTVRCVIHEKYSGKHLLVLLSLVTLLSAGLTIVINFDAWNIAVASICGFTAAQIAGGFFYQIFINDSTFVKVNGSDAVAIIFDSILFQLVAFSFISLGITLGQILIKFAGGFLWYLILFKKFKIHKRL